MTDPEILDLLKRIKTDVAFCKRELFEHISRFNQIESRMTSLELRLVAVERRLLLMKQTGPDYQPADWEKPFDSMSKHIDELIQYLESRDKEQ